MNVPGVSPPGLPGSAREEPMRGGWAAPAAAGAAAFWLANLAISATPVAADYRAALSIGYGPMLVESAVGGLVLAVALALVLVRHPSNIPGSGPLRKALVLGAAAILVVTVAIEIPSKVTAGLDDPGHWLLVATAFNLVRILSLAAAIGLVAGAGTRSRQSGHSRKGAVQ